MQGVSEVIAIILILMITIAIAGIAYTFMSSAMASTTSAASSTVTTTTSNMLTSFTIESIDIAKVYIRNTGQNALSSLSVYVNDEPAIYSITPSVIASGQIGTMTIYSFIPDGATVKITSPNGFSTSKVASLCAKAVGCWKLDEGSGTVDYDSSPNGNTGTLVNGTNWTTGIYGSAALFDGVNDCIVLPDSSSMNVTSNLITVSVLAKFNSLSGNQVVIIKADSGTVTGLGYSIRLFSGSLSFQVGNGTANIQASLTALPSMNQWHHIVGTFNGTHVMIYLDGVLNNSASSAGFNSIRPSSGNINMPPTIGNFPTYSQYFNGTIDEVRIYDRAIY